jgi:hypothetical protein
MTPEDLRAAVAAGIIDERKLARLKALADDRGGRRAALPAEDEPFEFFRGFSEIFISIGLIILLSGVVLAAGLVRRLCPADGRAAGDGAASPGGGRGISR